ncbi:MAG TPA: ribonuclease H-like domain-containing protein [Clostridia bacterium]|nr:ribonuclease H-like domain-containing protein [Clostridia bacterium]
MFLDLKSKLDLYKKETCVKSEKPKVQGPDIHQLLDGLVCTNEAGSFFSLEKRYPLTYCHGGYTLGQAANMDVSPISRILKDDINHLTVKDMLFFDTETTGLAGGTGTVAFLVGIGYFQEDCFIIKQFLMRDYDEECAMLTSLNQALREKKDTRIL